MIRGPAEYVPPVEVEVIMKRTAIPLDENEGIYVRDIKTGKVCVVQVLTLKHEIHNKNIKIQYSCKLNNLL